jgi:hypothetical protein
VTRPAAGVSPSAAVEPGPFAQLPWAVTHQEFVRAANAVGAGGACCVFVIDGSIPREARTGYAALVIAYARADEPVLILEDGGAALLVRDGGTGAGQVVARRVLGQMERLALAQTLRAGVVPLAPDCDASVRAARDAAAAADAGGVAVTA